MVASLGLAVLAAWVRLDSLPRLVVDPDWTWFLRVASQTSHGEAWVGPAMFMYSTLPSLLFGVLARLAGDGPAAIAAWTILGGLAAPLTMLAVRRVGGLPAGLVSGLVIALSETQIWVTTGLKSPYFVALAAALLALGLVEGTARRPWGPFLACQGATLMASLHLGLGPAGALGVLLAALHIVGLQGLRDRLLGLAGWLLGTLPITGWVLYVDRVRLLNDLEIHAAEPWRSWGDAGELLTRLEHGLSLTMDSARSLAGLALLGLLVSPLWFAWRRRRDPAPDLVRYGQGLVAAVQVGLVFAASLAPYLYQIQALHYFEVHHVVAAVPLGLVALAGLSRAIGPPRPALLGQLVAMLVLLPWLDDARRVPWPRPAQPDVLIEWPVQSALATAIRGEAGEAQPVVIGWLSDTSRADPVTAIRVLSELSRVGHYSERASPTCFVLSDQTARQDLPGLELLLELPEGAGLLLSDPGCERLPELAAVLCAGPEDRRLGLRHDYGGFVAERELLPDCYSKGVR